MCPEYRGPNVHGPPKPRMPQCKRVTHVWLLPPASDGPLLRVAPASYAGRWPGSQPASMETGELSFPTSFHLEYYTTLHNVYIQLNRPIFTSLVSHLIICNSCSYSPPLPCLSSLSWVSTSATFVSQSLWVCSCLSLSPWSMLLQFSLSLCVCFCLSVLLCTLLPLLAPSAQINWVWARVPG